MPYRITSRGRQARASPLSVRRLLGRANLAGFHDGSSSFAAALALATVLAAAAHVAGAAPPLPFATIHAFAIMFADGSG